MSDGKTIKRLSLDSLERRRPGDDRLTTVGSGHKEPTD